MSRHAEICVACGADLTETSHNPTCQNAPLTRPELDDLLYYRTGKPQHVETVNPDTGRIEWEAYEVTAQENLDTIINSPYLTGVTTGLLRELAALVQMADANKSIPTDEQRRGSRSQGIPSFDPADAQRRLDETEKRLRVELEKLSGVTRNPHRPAEPQCEECGRRERVADVFCGPCGSAILREHRRPKRKDDQ